ncbi:MAG: hypothetical protein ACPLZH_00570, partial [Minisyncoccales bacterium]
MNKINERQKLLLLNLIREYIEKPKLVSSFDLFKRLKGSFSPATIRNEMAVLTKNGYLKKDFFSAGRKPTDKAYRFFVNHIFQTVKNKKFFLNEGIIKRNQMTDVFSFFFKITKKLVLLTHLLTLGFLKEEEILIKEGWEKIIQAPEFKRMEFLKELIRFSENLEKFPQKIENNFDLKVYIGRKNPFGLFYHLSFFSFGFPFVSNKKCFFLLVGPKRID